MLQSRQGMTESNSYMHERHGRSHALYAEVIQASLAVTTTSLHMHCSNFALRRCLSALQTRAQLRCRAFIAVWTLLFKSSLG